MLFQVTRWGDHRELVEPEKRRGLRAGSREMSSDRGGGGTGKPQAQEAE